MKNTPFDSLVWGSLRLTPIIELSLEQGKLPVSFTVVGYECIKFRINESWMSWVSQYLLTLGILCSVTLGSMDFNSSLIALYVFFSCTTILLVTLQFLQLHLILPLYIKQVNLISIAGRPTINVIGRSGYLLMWPAQFCHQHMCMITIGYDWKFDWVAVHSALYDRLTWLEGTTMSCMMLLRNGHDALQICVDQVTPNCMVQAFSVRIMVLLVHYVDSYLWLLTVAPVQLLLWTQDPSSPG